MCSDDFTKFMKNLLENSHMNTKKAMEDSIKVDRDNEMGVRKWFVTVILF